MSCQVRKWLKIHGKGKQGCQSKIQKGYYVQDYKMQKNTIERKDFKVQCGQKMYKRCVQ